MHQHRFIHGDCRAGAFKFRVHFSGTSEEDHLLADILIGALGAEAQTYCAAKLKKLYRRNHGYEMVVTRGTEVLPDGPVGTGSFKIEYEIKTPAICSLEELEQIAHETIGDAILEIFLALLDEAIDLSVPGLLVLDLVTLASANGRERGGSRIEM